MKPLKIKISKQTGYKYLEAREVKKHIETLEKLCIEYGKKRKRKLRD